MNAVCFPWENYNFCQPVKKCEFRLTGSVILLIGFGEIAYFIDRYENNHKYRRSSTENSRVLFIGREKITNFHNHSQKNHVGKNFHWSDTKESKSGAERTKDWLISLRKIQFCWWITVKLQNSLIIHRKNAYFVCLSRTKNSEFHWTSTEKFANFIDHEWKNGKFRWSGPYK